MGFYGCEPFDSATAMYHQLGPEGPGVFYVEVEGQAPNFTSGITLVRDQHFVGGLKIDVMGWTGPRAEGTTHYKVNGSFPGQYMKEIIVSGCNKTIPVTVQPIPADETEAHLRDRAGAT